jgi:hypothetical protein
MDGCFATLATSAKTRQILSDCFGATCDDGEWLVSSSVGSIRLAPSFATSPALKPPSLSSWTEVNMWNGLTTIAVAMLFSDRRDFAFCASGTTTSFHRLTLFSRLFTKRCTDLKWMGASTKATRP